jgi:phenylpropionate dioxygenase-like ring-hydroxylating dioxygenase large terminal subunit
VLSSRSQADGAVRTSWVRSARSGDVGRTVLVWRLTHGGETRTVLLWRTRRGKAVATDARCPHRQYLMVDARLVRDAIECPVHGFRFGADGRCVNVRRAPAARLLEVREVDGYLWLAP